MAFKIGQSGNPSGRPKGIKDKRSAFKAMVEPNCEKLIQKAVDMALDGNEAMLRLLLDRVLPAKLREDPIPIDIKSESLIGQVRVILSELAVGNITPLCAKSLMDTVAIEAKIIESDELEKRIQVLEEINRIGVHQDEFIEEPDYPSNTIQANKTSASLLTQNK